MAERSRSSNGPVILGLSGGLVDPGSHMQGIRITVWAVCEGKSLATMISEPDDAMAAATIWSVSRD